MIKRPAQTELTWVKAVLVGLAITIFLLITLAWIPSYYTYWWASRDAAAIKIIQNVVHHLPGGAHRLTLGYGRPSSVSGVLRDPEDDVCQNETILTQSGAVFDSS